MLVCASCRNPVKPGETTCNVCGEALKIICRQCNRETFIGNNCEHCRASLYVTCKCGQIQLVSTNGKCRKCGEVAE